MNTKPPTSRPHAGPLPYQSPGAHQKSQWITDADGVAGRMLVIGLILLSIVGAVLGVAGAVVAFVLGWW